MKKTLILAALAALLTAGNLAAADLPPGRWWKMPNVVERLDLSTEQQEKLDAIFHTAANELIDRRGDVEKANVALRAELDQAQLNRQNVLRAAARVNEARGKLFERELAMLMDMRGVLNDPQWSRLRLFMENQRNQREQQGDRPPGDRPPGQGQPRGRRP